MAIPLLFPNKPILLVKLLVVLLLRSTVEENVIRTEKWNRKQQSTLTFPQSFGVLKGMSWLRRIMFLTSCKHTITRLKIFGFGAESWPGHFELCSSCWAVTTLRMLWDLPLTQDCCVGCDGLCYPSKHISIVFLNHKKIILLLVCLIRIFLLFLAKILKWHHSIC